MTQRLGQSNALADSHSNTPKKPRQVESCEQQQVCQSLNRVGKKEKCVQPWQGKHAATLQHCLKPFKALETFGRFVPAKPSQAWLMHER